MTDFLVGLGLVLVIEGLLWALLPGTGRRLLAAAAEMPDQSLRLGGAVAVAAGVCVVWFVRG
ncbi:MAG: DUF2065 domain-containing protein [Hyphomicrobiaceae bacterium]|nr:DUF2065 domain-containing protein [Hyphomicrobiaceae bacterium]